MEVRKISPGLSEIGKRRSAYYRSTVVGATVGLKRSDRAGHMTMCDAGGRRTPTVAGVRHVHMARMSSSRWVLKHASTIIDYSAWGSFAGKVVLWLVVHRRALPDSSD